MRQEQKDTLNAYAELKKEEKAIAEKLEVMKAEVLAVMQSEEAEEIELKNYGKLILGSRRAWTYSEFLQAKEKDLKDAKKIEEQTGVANYVENHYVVFKPLKEEI